MTTFLLMPYGDTGRAPESAVSLTGSFRGSPYRVPPDAA